VLEIAQANFGEIAVITAVSAWLVYEIRKQLAGYRKRRAAEAAAAVTEEGSA
jgi:hypothetical protein